MVFAQIQVCHQHYCFTFLGLNSFSELHKSTENHYHHRVLQNLPRLVRLGYVWEAVGLLDQLIAMQMQVPTNTDVFIAFWQGIKLVAIQPQMPTHLQLAKICRERSQLVAIQTQIPTHLQLAEICREKLQLVVIQIQTPTHLQLAEICRESLQLVAIQLAKPRSPPTFSWPKSAERDTSWLLFKDRSPPTFSWPKSAGRVCSWLLFKYRAPVQYTPERWTTEATHWSCSRSGTSSPVDLPWQKWGLRSSSRDLRPDWQRLCAEPAP